MHFISSATLALTLLIFLYSQCSHILLFLNSLIPTSLMEDFKRKTCFLLKSYTKHPCVPEPSGMCTYWFALFRKRNWWHILFPILTPRKLNWDLPVSCYTRTMTISMACFYSLGPLKEKSSKSVFHACYLDG